MMKTWLFIIIAVLFVILCSPISWSIENLAIRNPIGPGTVPPSSIHSGLVSSPAPLDTTGNLLITGNVRRGRHFRGPVPYQSTTSFSASLGSASLSSFLRDTAGPQDFGSYSHEYGTQPYYDPRQTVATMVPGRSGVFWPGSTRIDDRAQGSALSTGTDVFGLESLPTEQTLSGRGTTATDLDLQGPQTQYGPLAESRLPGVESRPILESTPLRGVSLSPQDAERLVPGEIGIRQRDEKSAIERFEEQVQAVRGETHDSTTALGLDSELLGREAQQGPLEKDDYFDYSNRGKSIEKLKSSLEAQTPAESATGLRQTDAARYGLPSLEEYAPSTDAGLQENIVLQRPSDLSDMSEQPQADQQGPAPGTLEALGRDRGDSPYELSTGSSLTRVGQEQTQGDVLERIRQQLDDLTKSIETSLQIEPGDASEAGSTELATETEEAYSGTRRYTLDYREAVRQRRIDSSNAFSSYVPRGVELGFDEEELGAAATGSVPGRADEGRQTGFEFAEIPNYESSQKTSSPLDELSGLSPADLSATAKRIMGPHKSLESFSEAKFNQHMRAAEDYLKAGRYYRAADTFTLASIYKPDNPQALAGRGHALFAAGEYVSSALFLARALAIAPEYARAKIDLAATLGDENKLIGRVTDVEEWLARSGSNELQFLLSYVYYQIGRLSEAKQAIDAAYQKTPQSPAVQALRTAIDARLRAQR